MIPFNIPDDWSPEQALAIYELLDALKEHVWQHYEVQLIGLLVPQINEDDTLQADLFEFDDDIPF